MDDATPPDQPAGEPAAGTGPGTPEPEAGVPEPGREERALRQGPEEGAPEPGPEPGQGAAGQRPEVGAPEPGQPERVNSRRPRDLLISLLVLLVPVVVLVGGYQLISGRTQPVEIDPSTTVAEARSTGFPVTEPAGLDPEWVPVSAVFQPREGGATLRIGYVSPEGGSVQLVQSTVPAEELLADQLAEAGPPTGSVSVAGRTWQVFATRPGERALVRLEPEKTTLVVGTAAESELRDLAAAL